MVARVIIEHQGRIVSRSPSVVYQALCLKCYWVRLSTIPRRHAIIEVTLTLDGGKWSA
jgi:hypothetical protein